MIDGGRSVRCGLDICKCMEIWSNWFFCSARFLGSNCKLVWTAVCVLKPDLPPSKSGLPLISCFALWIVMFSVPIGSELQCTPQFVQCTDRLPVNCVNHKKTKTTGRITRPRRRMKFSILLGFSGTGFLYCQEIRNAMYYQLQVSAMFPSVYSSSKLTLPLKSGFERWCQERNSRNYIQWVCECCVKAASIIPPRYYS